MRLDQIIDNAVNKVYVNVNAQKLQGGVAPVSLLPRSFASPMDVYDDENGYESPFDMFHNGANRSVWRMPDISISHIPVNALKSSGTPATTQTAQIMGGVIAGPVAPASGWSTVPNMEVSLVVNGPVHLTAAVPVQSTSANDTINFAFYRGQNQLSQIFSHTLPSSANKAVTVSLSIIDPNALVHSPLNTERYALYWKAGSGTLSSPGNARSMYAISLTPQ